MMLRPFGEKVCLFGAQLNKYCEINEIERGLCTSYKAGGHIQNCNKFSVTVRNKDSTEGTGKQCRILRRILRLIQDGFPRTRSKNWDSWRRCLKSEVRFIVKKAKDWENSSKEILFINVKVLISVSKLLKKYRLKGEHPRNFFCVEQKSFEKRH